MSIDVEAKSRGISRCECCGQVCPADRLIRDKFGWEARGVRDIRMVCRECSSALDTLAQKFRLEAVNISQVRAYRVPPERITMRGEE